MKTGDIIFAYKDIPINVSSIADEAHPVKVGVSDAYIIDRTIFCKLTMSVAISCIFTPYYYYFFFFQLSAERQSMSTTKWTRKRTMCPPIRLFTSRHCQHASALTLASLALETALDSNVFGVHQPNDALTAWIATDRIGW